MDDLLKGNFQVKNPIKTEEVKDLEGRDDSIGAARKRAALACLGGSMVYVEREKLSWDGDE